MKNILLAVTGLSPQVITETLYALHQDNRHVDAIHVITTRAGKEKIYAELLAGEKGQYFRYLEDYNLNPATIAFDHRHVHVVTDEHGVEIPDIATESDNEHLLRKCLDLTFNLTKDPETTVFFSVAGGRKTMSSCLTLAVQMYGRPQDRLYHVLISPEFESSREFYFPPRQSCSIELKDNQGHLFCKETRYAQVNLIHIPFVSIREQLSSDILKAPKDPGTLMLSLIKEERSHLTANMVSKKLVYKKIECDMHPAHLALYAFFLMQKKSCPLETAGCGNCTDCFIDIQKVFSSQNQITDMYRRMCGTRPLNEMSETGITRLNDDNFRSYKSKIKEKLQKSFGPYAAKELEIASVGTRPNTSYGIIMDKTKIEIIY